MIGIFSGTDMIKIWNWFTAIGSFVRKIQEKNTSAELSWCRNVSHRYRIVRVPNCLGAEMSRTGAEVSWCRIVPVPKYLAFTKKSNLPSLSLIILCQKTGMDRNYCLIVFIVYMSYSDTQKVAKCCLYEKKSMLKKKRKKKGATQGSVHKYL